MCGIIGFFESSSCCLSQADLHARLRNGIQRMRLRGPDAQGLCQVGPVSFGHARLAVIDPQGGEQPIRDEQTGVSLTYNGEIYNFRELRSQLQSRGHKFRTNCDTEVVLRAWIEWGTACFEKFNGFFALGIFDPRNGKITLARDRLGLKPLYFAETDDGFAFASTVNAILALRPGACRVDLPVMSHYLTSRLPVLNGRTLVEGIWMLSAGHYVQTVQDQEIEEEHAYWRRPIIPESEKSAIGFDEACGKTRDLLEDAIRMRLVSDVPVGAFLSGGLDSSIITTVATRYHDVPLPLFCAGSDDESLNEYHFAQQLATNLKLKLHLEQIDASAFGSNWRFLIREKGLPLSTPNEVSIYKLAGALRKQCTVTLTGEGADEVFGGYVQPQFGAYDFDRTPRSPDLVDDDAAITWALRMRLGRAWFMNDVDHILACDSWMTIPDKMRCLKPEVWDALEDDAEMLIHYEDFFNSLQDCSTFDKRMHLHAQFNLENLLLRVDSSTMAASVEARVPFTDYRLLELAFQLPDSYKMDWTSPAAAEKGKGLSVAQIDEAGLLETKRLPRNAFRADIPAEIIERRKMSFPVPFSDWLSGPLAEELRHTCLSSPLTHEHFNADVIEGMFARKDRNLWLVANLCVWWDELSQM